MNTLKRLASGFVQVAFILAVIIGSYYIGYHIGWMDYKNDDERRFNESVMLDVSINDTAIYLIKAGEAIANTKFVSTDITMGTWNYKPDTFPAQVAVDTISLLNPKAPPEKAGSIVISIKVDSTFTEVVRKAFRNQAARSYIHL